MKPAELPTVTLIGHPFAVQGLGRTHRVIFKALQTAGVNVKSLDVYGGDRGIDVASAAQIEPHLTRDFSPDINIFTLNGDEIQAALKHLGNGMSLDLPQDAYNIVLPFWELEQYPHDWAMQLERFDEVWASSSFIASAIDLAVTKPVVTLSHPIEPKIARPAGRRAFGIPESSTAFFFNFDFRSYNTRKNPEAVLTAFERLVAQRPQADIALVLKVTGSREHPQALDALQRRIQPLHSRIVLIADLLDDNAINNLVYACDCFLSLHRSEGFGQGLAEAMFFGKPVIATGYSGNMDFMSADEAMLVPYSMVPVADGDYPHATIGTTRQMWADADIDAAVGMMMAVLDNPAMARDMGQRAAARVRVQLSLRATGLAYRQRLQQIWDERQQSYMRQAV